LLDELDDFVSSFVNGIWCRGVEPRDERVEGTDEIVEGTDERDEGTDERGEEGIEECVDFTEAS
jgi:Ran GTPase-activating protein (RanGAP) involved in mRNA processing and transport